MNETSYEQPTVQPIPTSAGRTEHHHAGLLGVVLAAVTAGAVAGALVAGAFLWAAVEHPDLFKDFGPLQRLVESNDDPGRDLYQSSVILEESSNVIDVVDKANPAVVSIVGKISQRSFFFNQVIESEAAGTGFVIDQQNGIILTNRHVVSDNAEYRILTSNGTEIPVPGSAIHVDPLNDLAIIQVEIPDEAELGELTLGASGELVPGQQVIAIGNALGKFNNTVTTGVVSAVGRQINVGDVLGEEELLVDLIQTDAAINQGNSGGPLLNSLGQVVGINTAVAGGGENIGFAIPIDDARIAIQSYLENGEIIRPWLGISYVQITEDIAAAYDLPTDKGAYVAEVVANTPASKAEIKAGDILLAIDRKELNKDLTVVTVMQDFQVDDVVDVKLMRPDNPDGVNPEYKEMTLQVTLEARNSETSGSVPSLRR